MKDTGGVFLYIAAPDNDDSNISKMEFSAVEEKLPYIIPYFSIKTLWWHGIRLDFIAVIFFLLFRIILSAVVLYPAFLF